jgi:hypothetical protein
MISWQQYEIVDRMSAGKSYPCAGAVRRPGKKWHVQHPVTLDKGRQ